MLTARIVLPAVLLAAVVFVVLFVILPVTLWVSILAAAAAFVLYVLAGEATTSRGSSPPHGA